MTGCTAAGGSVGAHAELDLGVIKVGASVQVNAQGQKLFVIVNPTDTEAWIQPVDSNGNPIGDPLPIPPGGSVELPPGADDKKSHLVKKPEPTPPPAEPKPVPGTSSPRQLGLNLVTAQPAPMLWGGGTTSFGEDGTSSAAEYSIAAVNIRAVFQTLAQLDQGQTPANAMLVCRTSLTPLTASSASLNIVLPSNNVASFRVYVNGALVASSASGLGGAIVTYSADGYGYGSATIPFSAGASSNSIQVITVDHLGVPTTRSMSYAW